MEKILKEIELQEESTSVEFLNKEVSTLEAKIKDLDAKAKAIQNKVQAEYPKLKKVDDLESLEKAVKDSQQKIEEDWSAIEGTYDQLKVVNKGKKDLLDKTEAYLQEAKGKKEERHKELKNIKESLIPLLKQEDSLAKELKAKQQKLAQHKNKIEKLEDEIRDIVVGNPEILDKHKKKVEYVNFDHLPLFKADKEGADISYENGVVKPVDIHYSDVEQKELGDCYFLAPLAEIAKNDPEKIRAMISPNDKPPADGVYTVTFKKTDFEIQFDKVFGDDSETITVEVTASFPVYKGTESTAYAGFGDGEIWVALIEKAYAKVMSEELEQKSSYETIGGGGPPSNALDLLVGGDKSTTITPQLFSAEGLFDKLNEAAKTGKHIVFTTKPVGSDIGGELLPSFDEKGKKRKSKYLIESEVSKPDKVVVFLNHVYSLISVLAPNKVILDNPHKDDSRDSRNLNTLAFTMKEIQKYFREIAIKSKS